MDHDGWLIRGAGDDVGGLSAAAAGVWSEDPLSSRNAFLNLLVQGIVVRIQQVLSARANAERAGSLEDDPTQGPSSAIHGTKIVF